MLPELISVAIIEDQPDICEGLGMLIRGTPGYRVTGSFRTMEEALAGIGKGLPDVLWWTSDCRVCQAS